jgi:hypothetical protein
LAVAEWVNGVWEWKKELPDTYRQYYYKKEHMDRFSQSGNTLYVWMHNKEYVKRLAEAGVKVAGNVYVLAINLARGKRTGKDFRRIYEGLRSGLERGFSNYYPAREIIPKLEKYLKQHALACGVLDGGKVRWRPPAFGEIELKTLQEYYSRNKENFIVIDDILYYLRPYSLGVEALFFKCLTLAGSEYALAVATSGGDEGKKKAHETAFKRLSFKQRKNIAYYADVFERYLAKNQQLFDEAVAV